MCIWTVCYFFFRYKREFGFVIEHRPIVIDDIIVKGIAKSQVPLVAKQNTPCTQEAPVEKVAQ